MATKIANMNLKIKVHFKYGRIFGMGGLMVNEIISYRFR